MAHKMDVCHSAWWPFIRSWMDSCARCEQSKVSIKGRPSIWVVPANEMKGGKCYYFIMLDLIVCPSISLASRHSPLFCGPSTVDCWLSICGQFPSNHVIFDFRFSLSIEIGVELNQMSNERSLIHPYEGKIRGGPQYYQAQVLWLMPRGTSGDFCTI